MLEYIEAYEKNYPTLHLIGHVCKQFLHELRAKITSSKPHVVCGSIKYKEGYSFLVWLPCD